jgi:HEPN domain-containing protein
VGEAGEPTPRPNPANRNTGIHKYHQVPLEGKRKLVDFVNNKYKRVLLIAEEAYTLSRYGDVECSVEDSKEVVNVASQLIELLEEVSRIVKLG